MPGFEILPASLKDLGALRRLEQECFELDAWPLVDLMAVLTWPGIVRLKAEVDGAFAGFVAGDPKPGEGIGWVTTIGVFNAYRRRGIASALLSACEAEMGMRRVRLSVRRSNLAAIAMYSKYGYSQLEVWPGYYNGGEDGLVLERKIS